MFCDASDIGIGGVLLQNGKIVGLYSKKLNDTECNYTTVEKELYAIIKSLEKFKNITWGNNINIYTDSRNILSLKEGYNKRIQRWKLLLNEYDYELIHVKGQNNAIADELSRSYVKNENCKAATHAEGREIEEKILATHVQLIHAGEEKV